MKHVLLDCNAIFTASGEFFYARYEEKCHFLLYLRNTEFLSYINVDDNVSGNISDNLIIYLLIFSAYKEPNNYYLLYYL